MSRPGSEDPTSKQGNVPAYTGMKVPSALNVLQLQLKYILFISIENMSRLIPKLQKEIEPIWNRQVYKEIAILKIYGVIQLVLISLRRPNLHTWFHYT